MESSDSSSDRIEILSIRKFSDEQRAKICAVSPRIDLIEVDGRSDNAAVTAAMSAQTQIMYAFRGSFDVAAAPNLKWVQMENAGVDHLHGSPLWQRSEVVLTSANGAHSPQMPEYVMAVLLAHMHRLPMTLDLQAKQVWGGGDLRNQLLPRELRGLTMGILGYGAIGRELAQLAQAFGMRIVATARDDAGAGRYAGYLRPGVGDAEGTLPARYFTLDKVHGLLAESDVIVLALPMSARTRHIIDAAALQHVKPGAVLINIGRGGLIDQDALQVALAQRALDVAILDVTDPEPLPADHPLWQNEHVWITPHISGQSTRYIDNTTDIFAENLRRYIAGEALLNIVQRELGY